MRVRVLRRYSLAFAALLAVAAPASAGPAAGATAPAAAPAENAPVPPGFTPEQRGEIVQIMREALRSDPTILRDAVAALQREDAAQRDATASAAVAAQRQRLVSDPADAVAGNPAGDVTIVEFYDTRCPYCRGALPTLASLVHDDPNLRIVYKDLPVLGPNSLREAKALIAAQRQGDYLRMQDAVMHLAAPSTDDGLQAEAVRQGLDGSRFAIDMADPATLARLQANANLAAALHVDGTPVFVIGDQVIPGAVPLAALQHAVATARDRRSPR